MFSKPFLTEREQHSIQNAIAEAEMMSSGEIRVHIETSCNAEAMLRAIEVFKKLKMDETDERNAVLIYLAHKDHKFAIIGDKGINEKVPEGFWDDIRKNMAAEFAKGNFAEGLVAGIQSCGKKLKEFFPLRNNDRNELDNEISYGE